MNLMLTGVLHAANYHDSKTVFKVIEIMKYRFPRLFEIIPLRKKKKFE